MARGVLQAKYEPHIATKDGVFEMLPQTFRRRAPKLLFPYKFLQDHVWVLNMYGMIFAGYWLLLQTTMPAISKSKYYYGWCLNIVLLNCRGIGNIISMMDTYFVIVLVELSKKYEHKKKLRIRCYCTRKNTLSNWVTSVLLQ